MSGDPLKNEEWGSLLEGLARDEYHLLLGAGASMDARGGDGRPLPIPIGVACAAAGITSSELSKELSSNGQLAGIVRVEPKGLRPRHRVVASLVIERALDRADRFPPSQTLAKALAPYVTPDTIRQRTLAYRIVRNLLDQEVVFDWVGSNRAREWYDALVPEYSWNARFWEQRALAEAKLNHFPKARSFAEEALRIQKHPFTLNTLGTILLQMATNHFPPGSSESNNVFWEGVTYLRESRDRGEGQFEHPYVTFFTYTLRFAELTCKDQAINSRLATEWQRWMRVAEQAQVFRHSDNYQHLRNYHQQWLLLAAKAV